MIHTPPLASAGHLAGASIRQGTGGSNAHAGSGLPVVFDRSASVPASLPLVRQQLDTSHQQTAQEFAHGLRSIGAEDALGGMFQPIPTPRFRGNSGLHSA